MPESLADKMLRWNPPKKGEYPFFRPDAFQIMRSKLYHAPKFVFDREASQAVAELILNHPQEIINSLDSVKLPYREFWIESYVFGDHLCELLGLPPLYESERKLTWEKSGIFINDGDVYHFSEMGTDPSNPEMVIGWDSCRLNTRWSREDQNEFFEKTKISDRKLTILGGELLNASAWKALPEEEFHKLLDNVEVNWWFPHPSIELVANNITFGGNIVETIAYLMMLNSPQIVRTVEIPGSRQWSRGKSRVVRSHHQVVLNVTRKEIVRYVQDVYGREATAKRAASSVRGHFAHRWTSLNKMCIHTWTANDDTHWHCQTCGGHRWWVIDHKRGKGVPPTPGYSVTL